MRILLVATGLVLAVTSAHAMSYLPCRHRPATVPENPSIIVRAEQVHDFYVETKQGQRLPFHITPFTDHWVWVTIPASDGTELSTPFAEGPRCGQFDRMVVSRRYRAQRAVPAIASIDDHVSVTLGTVPSAWVQVEWAYTPAALTAGLGGLAISGLSSEYRPDWFGVSGVKDTDRPLFLRMTLLFPDQSVGPSWEGWYDPATTTFGIGTHHVARPPATRRCASSPTVMVPRAGFVFSYTETRYRAVDVHGRPIASDWRYHAAHEFELVPHVAPDTDFWIVELPNEGAPCHGPFRVAATTPTPVKLRSAVVGPTGHDVALELDRALHWGVRLEWAASASDLESGRGRSKMIASTSSWALSFGDDVPDGATRLYLRLTPLFADGTFGPTTQLQLARRGDRFLIVP
jgi:hypothetical protein